MLNRFPGPGVHAVLPETSISQNADGSVALPGSRQLIPTIAMGSTEPWLTVSTGVPISCLLRTDHGVDGCDDSSLRPVSLPDLTGIPVVRSLILTCVCLSPSAVLCGSVEACAKSWMMVCIQRVGLNPWLEIQHPPGDGYFRCQQSLAYLTADDLLLRNIPGDCHGCLTCWRSCNPWLEISGEGLSNTFGPVVPATPALPTSNVHREVENCIRETGPMGRIGATAEGVGTLQNSAGTCLLCVGNVHDGRTLLRWMSMDVFT